jgi:WD40 repeat protein
MIHVRSAVLALRCLLRLGMAIIFAFLAAAGAARSNETKTPRTDLYGDPLPPGAIARLGTIHLWHADRDIALAFSKDGKRLISCGLLEVRVWDVAPRRLVRRTPLVWKAREYIWNAGISLTPDGATTAAWDTKTTYLYDTATGRERGRFPGAQVLAFSSDGKKMAVREWDQEGKMGFVQLWDVIEFKKHLSLDVPPRIVLMRAVFSPDGKQLAALGGEGEELFVWDAVTGRLQQRKKFDAPMLSLAYAPDGATLAVGRKGTVEAVLFETSTWKEKAAVRSPANVKGGGEINLIGFSPDGRRLAAGCADGVLSGAHQEYGLLIWDLSDPERPRRRPAPHYLRALVFAPDGKTLVCCNGGSPVIDLWDVASLHQRPGHYSAVWSLAVSPDGKTLASSDHTPTLRLWDTATSKPLRSLAGSGYATVASLFSADGQRLISISKWKLQVWEAATGKELCHFLIDSPFKNVTGFEVETVALSGDSKRLAAVAAWRLGDHLTWSDISRLIFIWDTATGKHLNRRPLAREPRVRGSADQEVYWPAVLAPDGESVAVWRGDQLILEDISSKTLLATLPEGVGRPQVFSADGRLLAAKLLQPRKQLLIEAEVKGLSLIETASGQEVVRLEIRNFYYVAFTPDSRAVVVADKQKLSVWDVATGERLHQMEWPESVEDQRGRTKLSSLAVLPGGRVAIGTVEGDILIWDLAPSTWPVRRPARELSRAQFDTLWADLARDARTAYRAVSLLAAAPAWSVPLLGAHLHPVAVDSKHIEKLLADLDDERYEVREAASRELARLRYHAEPIVRRALHGKPTLETRRRIEAILDEPKCPPTEALRTLRAITILERIGTPEARRILEKLAAGAASPETRAAEATLQRLKYR